MKAGDLIEWEKARWLVHKVERATNSVIVIDAAGQRDFLAQDLDETEPENCKVVCNPATDWPFLTLPTGRNYRKLQTVIFPDALETTGERQLIPLVDWMRPDPFQQGGPLFLNPELQLGFGHVIVLCYETGRTTLRIAKGFGTSAQRVARVATNEEASPRTSFDRLLEGDFDDE